MSGMGDLGIDTSVEEIGPGAYRAVLSADWEIWGPMGGYVAACALRAAGASSTQPRPAALSCHYLGVARFGAVDIRVESRRGGRTAESQRVEVAQAGRPILDAMVWSVADGVEGLEHDQTAPPDVHGPEDLPSLHELVEADAAPPYPFWGNLDAKPVEFERPWPPDGPRPARWQQWLRFTPTATFEDAWVDAARAVILVDLPSWPSAQRHHAWRQPAFIAPSLDLHVTFHTPTNAAAWLLCDGDALLSTAGRFGWNARVWSAAGQLHASGGGQCLYRPLPAGP